MANEKKGLVDITTGTEVNDANANGVLDRTSAEISFLTGLDQYLITTSDVIFNTLLIDTTRFTKAAGISYMNFGGGSGSGGYGIRDDALNSVIEVKNIPTDVWSPIHHNSSCKERLTANQASSGAGAVTVQFDKEVWDKRGEFNTGTYTFTADQAGRYIISGYISIVTSVATPTVVSIQVIQDTSNIAEFSAFNNISTNPDSWVVPFSIVVDLAANGTIAIDLIKSLGTATYTIQALDDETWLTISRIQ